MINRGLALVLGLVGLAVTLIAVVAFDYNRLSRGYIVDDPLLLDGYGPAMVMGLVGTASLVGSVAILLAVRRRERQRRPDDL
ncbi:hypothetical protein [Nocardioides nanhaiensis]|uniref:DUF3955 domain-containing protein n=1 Tax=Nocardioides nanhaiensis TaxID=1476871 RepID=A0ABP8WVG1_9ACTN